MRKTITTFVVLFVLWLGYVLWPLHDLVQIVRAFERRDVDTLISHVNFPELRASIARQVVDAYIKRAAIRVSPLILGSAEVSSIADPIVAKVVTPEALAALLSNGWPVTVVQEKPADTVGITSANMGTVWQLFAGSEYGFGHFDVALPVTLAPEHRFALDFRLSQWRWRLVRITLPENIQNLLADELIKTLKPSPVTP